APEAAGTSAISKSSSALPSRSPGPAQTPTPACSCTCPTSYLSSRTSSPSTRACGARSGQPTPRSGRIRRVRRRRLPHADRDDVDPQLPALIENQLRNPLDRRIALEDVDRLAQLLQRLHQRIVVPEDHLVIQLAIDQPLDDPLDVAEVGNHVPVVER